MGTLAARLGILVLSFGTMFALPAAAAVLTYLIVPGEAFLPKSINLALVLLAIFCALVAFLGIRSLRSQVAPNPGQATQAARLNSNKGT
jgi:hypothetical protein